MIPNNTVQQEEPSLFRYREVRNGYWDPATEMYMTPRQGNLFWLS